MDYNQNINKHYGSGEIGIRILKALPGSGSDFSNTTRDDLVSFVEFHIGGTE